MTLLHINIILKLSCPIFKNSLLTKYKKKLEKSVYGLCVWKMRAVVVDKYFGFLNC